MMKLLFAVGFTFTLIADACMDPPTPVQLSNTSFENEEIQVTPRGASFAHGRLLFNEQDQKWCRRDREAKKDDCAIKATLPLKGAKGAVVGVLATDNKKKTATLKSV